MLINLAANMVSGSLAWPQLNVLITSDHRACLSDFRVATVLVGLESPGSPTTDRPTGSLRFLAPELLYPEAIGDEQGRNSKESDIYAFACVCYEVPWFSALDSHEAF